MRRFKGVSGLFRRGFSGRLRLLLLLMGVLLGIAQQGARAAVVNLSGASTNAAVNITLYVNGIYQATTSGANYTFSAITVNAGETVLIYYDDDNLPTTNPGVLVTMATGADMTGLDIAQNVMRIRSDGGAITDADISASRGISADGDLPFLFTPGYLQMANANATIIHVPAGHTWTPTERFQNLYTGGVNLIEGTLALGNYGTGAAPAQFSGQLSVSTTGVVNIGSGYLYTVNVVTFAGALNVSSTGVFRGDNNINFSGTANYTGAGTFSQNGLASTFNGTGSTFTMNQAGVFDFFSANVTVGTVTMTNGTWRMRNTTTTTNFNPNGQTYWHFTYLGTNARTLNLLGNLSVGGNFRIQNGTVDIGANSVTVAGAMNWDNAATRILNVNTGQFTVTGATTLDNDANLLIGNGGIFTANGAFNTNGGVGGHVQFVGTGNLRLNGTVGAPGTATLTGSGTVRYGGTTAAQTIQAWGSGYYNLEIQNTGQVASIAAATTLSVSNTLTMSSGTLDLNGRPIVLNNGAVVTLSGGTFRSNAVGGSVSAVSGTFTWNDAGATLDVVNLDFSGADASGWNKTAGTITNFNYVNWTNGTGTHLRFAVGLTATLTGHSFDATALNITTVGPAVGTITMNGASGAGIGDGNESQDPGYPINWTSALTLNGNFDGTSNISYAVDGILTGTYTTNSTPYSITLSATSGQIITLWYDDGTNTVREAIVYKTDGASHADLHFIAGKMIVRSDTAAPINNGDIQLAHTGDGNLPWTNGASNLVTVGDSAIGGLGPIGLYVPVGQELEQTGDVDVTGTAGLTEIHGIIDGLGYGIDVYNSNFTIASTAVVTYTDGRMGCLTAGYDWNISGSITLTGNAGRLRSICDFDATGGTLSYTGTLATQTWLRFDTANVYSLGTYTNTTGTVIYWQTAYHDILGGTFYRLYLNSGANTLKGNITLNAGGALIMANTATLSTSSYDVTLNGNAAMTLAAGNRLDISGGVLTMGTGTLTNAGTINLSGGAFTHGGTLNNTGTLYTDGGTYTNTSNVTGAGAFNLGSTSMTMNATVNIAGTVNFYNVGNLYLGGSPTSLGTLNAGTGAVIYNGTGTQTVLGTTYYNLEIDKGSGQANLGANTTVTNALTLTNGTFELNGKTLSIGNGGTVQLDAGIFQSTVAGGGVTRSGGGNYSFNAAGSAINITTMAFSRANNSGFNITAGTVTSFQSVAFTNGTAGGNHMRIATNLASDTWTGLSFDTTTTCNIRRTAALTNAMNMATYSGTGAGEARDCEPAEGLINWQGTVILSGSNVAGDPAVSVRILSASAGQYYQAAVVGGGVWTVTVNPGDIAVGSAIIAYVDDNAAGNVACLVSTYQGGDLGNLNLTLNQVILRNDDGVGGLTNTDIVNATPAVADSDITECYALAGSVVNFATGQMVVIPNGHTVTMIANMTTSNTAGAGINVQTGGTLDLGGAFTFTSRRPATVAGTLKIPNGATFNNATANATFDATGGSIDFTGVGNQGVLHFEVNPTSLGTLDSAAGIVQYGRNTGGTILADDYYRLTVADGVAGAQVFNLAGTTTANNVYANDGEINLNGQSLTVWGTAANSILVDSPEILNIAGGTLTHTQSAGTIVNNGTISIAAGTFNAAGATWTGNTTGALTFTGAGTLNISSAAITGNVLATTFTQGTGTVAFGYSGGNTSVPAHTYYNLSVSVTSARTASLIGTTTVQNNLTLNSGTFDLNAQILQFAATGGANLNGGAFKSTLGGGTVQNSGGAGYFFTVNGATVNVTSLAFTGAGANGFDLNGSTSPVTALNNITWSGGTGTYLRLSGALGTQTFSGHVFPAGVTNVTSVGGSTGTVSMASATGAGVGDANESEGGTVINWPATFTISGTYDNVTPVSIAINGAKVSTYNSGGGTYTFGITANTGDILTLWYDNNAAGSNGCRLAKFTGANMTTGMDMVQGEFILGQDSAGSTTTSDAITGFVASEANDICYSYLLLAVTANNDVAVRVPAGASFTQAGTLTVNNVATGLIVNGTLSQNTNTLTNLGNLNIATGGVYTVSTGGGSVAGATTISGSFTKNDAGGTYTFTGNLDATGGVVNVSNSGVIQLRGVSNPSLGTFTSDTTGVVQYNCTANCTVAAGAYGRLQIFGPGFTHTLLGNSSANNVTNQALFVYNNGTIFDMAGYTFAATGQVRVGNVATNTSRLNLSGGTLTSTTSGLVVDAATLDVGSGNATFTTTYSQNPAGDLLISTGTMRVDGNFNMTGGNLTFSGAGNLILKGATLTSLGTFTPATGTVQLSGSNTQTIPLNTYNNLTINKTTGTTASLAAGSTTVNTALSVTGGTFNINGQTLQFAAGATASLTGGTLQSTTIGGNITRTGVGSYTFTVGGATLNVSELSFSYADADGFNWQSGTLTAFNGVNFTNGTTTHMTIADTLTGTFSNLTFDGGGGVPFNLTKQGTTGAITVNNHSGTGTGENNDVDPNLLVTWSGTVTYTGTFDGVTDVGIAINGTVVDVWTADSSPYTFTVGATTGDKVVIYYNSTVTRGSVATVATNGNLSGLDLTVNRMVIRSDGDPTGMLTSDIIAACPGTSPCYTNLPYTIAGGAVNPRAATTVQIPVGHIYNMDGANTHAASPTGTLIVDGNLTLVNFTYNTTGAACDINGSVTINGSGLLDCGNFDATGATLTMGGAATNIQISGNVTSMGTITTTMGTVILDGTGAQNFPAASLFNLTLNNGGGCGTPKNLTGNITLAGTLTPNSGCLQTDGFNITGAILTVTNNANARLEVNGGASTFTGNVTIGGPNGQILMTSGTLTAAANTTGAGTLQIVAGTYNSTGTMNVTGNINFTGAGTLDLGGTVTNLGTLMTTAGTVRYTGSVNQAFRADTYFNVVISSSATVTLGAGTNQIDGTLTLQAGTLDISSRTLTMGSGAIGSLTGGIFKATTVGGVVTGLGPTRFAWTVNGSAMNISNMAFNGADASGWKWQSGTVSNFAGITFTNGLTTHMTVDGAVATFPASSLNFDGAPGVLNVTSTAGASGTLNIIGATCTAGTGICEDYDVDSGATITWNTTLTYEGTCDQNGATISLSVAGAAPVLTTACNTAGVPNWQMTPTAAQVPLNSVNTLYYDGAASKGVILTKSNGSTHTDMNLAIGELRLRDETANGLTNTDLNTGNNADAVDIPYVTAGGAGGSNMTGTGGLNVRVVTGHIWAPGNNDNTTAANLNVDGKIIMNTAARFVRVDGTATIPGTVQFDATGYLDINGPFNATGGTLDFNAAGYLQMATTGAGITSFGNVTPINLTTGQVRLDGNASVNVPALTIPNFLVAMTGGTAMATGTLSFSNQLVITTGSLDTNGQSVTVNGTAGNTVQINGGNITVSTGSLTSAAGGTFLCPATLNITNGTVDINGPFNGTSGTLNMTGASGRLQLGGTITPAALGTTTTFTNGTVAVDYTGGGTNIAVPTYNNFEVNSGAQIVNLTSATGVTFNGNVTVLGGTLNPGAYTHVVHGNWNDSAGSFNPASGTVQFAKTSSSQGITQGASNRFNNLSKTAAGTLVLSSGVYVKTALASSAGTFDMNGQTLRIGNTGSATFSGGTFQSLLTGSTVTSISGTGFSFAFNSGSTMNIANLAFSNAGSGGFTINNGVTITDFDNASFTTGNTRHVRFLGTDYLATWANHYYDATAINISTTGSTCNGAPATCVITMNPYGGAGAGDGNEQEGAHGISWGTPPIDHFAVAPDTTTDTVDNTVILTITAQDVVNATVPAYASGADLTITAPAAPGGTCTFSGTGVTDNSNCTATLAAGAWTLGVATVTVGYTKTGETDMVFKTADTGTPTISGSSAAVTWQPGVATEFGIATQNAGTENVDTTFNLTLTALDQYDNTVSFGPNNYAGAKTVSFASTAGTTVSCSPTVPASESITFAAGVGTSAAGGFRLVSGSQTPTITATEAAVTSTSAAITVNVGALAGYTMSDPGAQNAGTCFSSTITAVDQCQNTRSTDASTVDMTENANASFYTTGACGVTTTSYILAAGTATAYVKDDVAETVMLTSTKQAGAEYGERPVVINPGTPAHVRKHCNVGATACIGDSSGVFVNQDQVKLPVYVEDALGNRVSGVSVAAAVGGGGGSLSGSPVVTDAAGVSTFVLTTGAAVGANTVNITCAACTITNAQSFTITTTASSNISDLNSTAGGIQGVGSANNTFYDPTGTDLVLHPIFSNGGAYLGFIGKPTGACSAGTDCNWNVYVKNADGTGGVTRVTNDLHYVIPASAISFNASGTAPFGTADSHIVFAGQRVSRAGDYLWSNEAGNVWKTAYLSPSVSSTGPHRVVDVTAAPGTELIRDADNSTPALAGHWSFDTAGGDMNTVRVYSAVALSPSSNIRIVERVGEVYGAARSGADAAAAQTSLTKLTKTSKGLSGPIDPHWNACGFVASYQGNIVKYNTPGLANATQQEVQYITRFNENRTTTDTIELAFEPKLHPTNCGLVAFMAWNTGVTVAQAQSGTTVSTSPGDIYLAQDANCTGGGGAYNNMLNPAWTPPTGLASNACVTISQVTTEGQGSGKGHFFPSWMADGASVTYSKNEGGPTNDLFISDLYLTDTNVEALFNNLAFRGYVEYVWNGSFQGAVPAQPIGDFTTDGAVSTNNVYGLTQCGGAGCPTGRPFAFISSNASNTNTLKTFTLADEATIQSSGGLLFYNGRLTAVFPPGSWNGGVNSETRLVTAGEAASLPDLTAVDDDTSKLVYTGVTRNLGPDGTKFGKNIQLVFSYCDTGNTGYLDVNQDATCTGGGKTTIDERKLYVYYWNDTANSWDRYGGVVDVTNNTITAETDHFSTYAAWGAKRGALAPVNFQVLSIAGLHTYPNPFQHSAGGNITFNATAMTATGNVLVRVRVYDIRGKEVATLQSVVDPAACPGGVDCDPNGGKMLLQWNGRDRGGSPLPAGVYLYRLEATDMATGFRQAFNAKLSIVK